MASLKVDRKFGKILIHWLFAILESCWARELKLSGMCLQAKVYPGKLF